jgi:hypothetical protein
MLRDGFHRFQRDSGFRRIAFIVSGIDGENPGADLRFFDEELARWRRVIDSSGIKLEP